MSVEQLWWLLGVCVVGFIAVWIEEMVRASMCRKRQKQIDEHHQLQYQQWHNLISMKGDALLEYAVIHGLEEEAERLREKLKRLTEI